MPKKQKEKRQAKDNISRFLYLSQQQLKKAEFPELFVNKEDIKEG